MSALEIFVSSEKLISFFPGWSQPEPETGYSWFDAPLEIGGIVEAGLTLHGGCLTTVPDRHVTFEIVFRDRGGRRRIPLARICWRSLKGGHTNPLNSGPRHLRGQRVSATHHHAFAINWIPSEQRMRGRNLPFAEEIAEPLQSFEALRAFTGTAFKLSNIDIVPAPEWEYDLFP